VDSRVEYREYRSSPRLAGLVDRFWTSARQPQSAAFHRVLPDGCMDIVFDFRAAGDSRVTIVGTMTGPLLVASAGMVDLLGIRFRPGGLPALFDLDAAQAKDKRLPLSGLIGSRAVIPWERLAGLDPGDRPGALERMLGEEGEAKIDPLVNFCVSRIEASGGRLRMAGLEAAAGLGLRRIERRFERHVGISPKAHARIIRFQAAVASLAVPDMSGWADRAFACGYADQAHLSREFQALAGLSPSDYARSLAGPADMSHSFKTGRCATD
jgi:methylphosphotriester-DNA--protein-cysteine methyltransferase